MDVAGAKFDRVDQEVIDQHPDFDAAFGGDSLQIFGGLIQNQGRVAGETAGAAAKFARKARRGVSVMILLIESEERQIISGAIFPSSWRIRRRSRRSPGSA